LYGGGGEKMTPSTRQQLANGSASGFNLINH